MDGFVLVRSGRPIPADGEPVQRNAGVGILLNPTVAAAWRDSGEWWRAISSRIVSVRIQLQRCTSCGVNRQNGIIYLTVISAYAPTFCSPQEYKDQFYDDLMCTISSVCQDYLLLVVGDFNARVGSNHPELVKGEWSGVRSNHGVGNVNGAGRALLTFCAVNGLTVMNTWCEKKDIYK